MSKIPGYRGAREEEAWRRADFKRFGLALVASDNVVNASIVSPTPALFVLKDSGQGSKL
jgi:hypothetical protein